ncbi:hypothetical protein PIB30_040903 [Stylosanthes scabra]|uniref:Uncharacterized protein n=1 Tax=Stylosanthes scabra TaxID=79078 RepID=A0ABU6WG26_9FABA|nr:hypothetical protein [Stylosanthes scabra]
MASSPINLSQIILKPLAPLEFGDKIKHGPFGISNLEAMSVRKDDGKKDAVLGRKAGAGVAAGCGAIKCSQHSKMEWGAPKGRQGEDAMNVLVIVVLIFENEPYLGEGKGVGVAVAVAVTKTVVSQNGMEAGASLCLRRFTNRGLERPEGEEGAEEVVNLNALGIEKPQLTTMLFLSLLKASFAFKR